MPPLSRDGSRRTAADHRSPDYAEYCRALGEAILESGHMFAWAYDILRLHEGSDRDLLSDVRGKAALDLSHGQLGSQLRELRGRKEARGDADASAVKEFSAAFDEATALRNDLAHGLPTRQGLLRAKRGRLYDTVESIQTLTRQFRRVGGLACQVMFSDPARYEPWKRNVQRGHAGYVRPPGTSAPDL